MTSGGREFAVRSDDMEPRARVAGARVRFDRVRDDGADRAVRVRMRTGTRTSRRQRRFGDLTGSHHPPDKGYAPSRDRPRESRPVRVVEGWARSVGDGDQQAAASWYAPDVVIHDEGRDAGGPRGVQRWLETGGLMGSSTMGVEVHPQQDVVVVTWPPTDEFPGPTLVQLRVAHGRIAEQWNTRS